MRGNKNLLLFIGIIASALCQNSANAALVNCPEGCFCLNNGKYDNSGQVNPIGCNAKGQLMHTCYGLSLDFYGGMISCSHNMGGTYYFDQFSELYDDYFGYYGILNGEMLYMTRDYGDQSVFGCPASHPHSSAGAKSVIECYKYDNNGNKKYFKVKQSITCAAGQYLPANATQCVSCSAAQHHICPGGTFEKMNKIQGLKLDCFPGEYLESGATQCSSCNTNFYLCPGGVYNAGETTEQGRVLTNGYFSGANHNFISCQPGYFVPPMANQCAKCTNANAANFACPGGMFYIDGQYQFARGAVTCAYGHPNSEHTQCVAESTMPSFMVEKMSALSNSQQQQTDKSGQQTGTTTSVQHKVVTKGSQRLSKGKVQTVKPVVIESRTQPTVTVQQPAQPVQSEPEMTKEERELEAAKKLISSGMSLPTK